jgi:hypothetical protein
MKVCRETIMQITTNESLLPGLYGTEVVGWGNTLHLGIADLEYVPFLHSNNSTVENIFPPSRGQNRDTAAKFPKSLTQQSVVCKPIKFSLTMKCSRSRICLKRSAWLPTSTTFLHDRMLLEVKPSESY